MRQGWAQSQDGVQQASVPAPITRAGPFESAFPDPSAQNSQHLWKTFRLCSRDTLSNHWHFLLLLQPPKGIPDGASVKWCTAHTPQSPGFNPGCHLVAPSENASLLTEYLLEGSVTFCLLSRLFPALSSLNQAWGDEMLVQDSWRSGHREILTSVILAHCPADSSWWFYTPHHPDMPETLRCA